MNAAIALEPPSQRVPSTPRGPVLQLTLLGPFSATIDGVQLRFATRKAKAVLAFVAMGDVAGESRESLLGLLWSERDKHKAQGSLRHAVKEVNDVLQAAGFTGFHAAKQSLALDASMVTTDLASVVTATNNGVAHARLLETSRLADTLLSDLETVDPQFQAWVGTKRHALHDRLTMALERALPTVIGDGNSVDLGQALLSLDPTNEVACRHVIHARVARGEIGGALKAYKTLWDELDAEFDTEPAPETQDLIVKIKQGSGWSMRPGAAVVDELPVSTISLAAPDAPPPLRKLFIVVENFDVEGVPAKSRYVINGFRHELVATLARFREWSVRAEKAKSNAAHDGADRATEYTFSATAYGDANGFYLIATLADDKGDIVWSQPYTLQLSDLMSSQKTIVRQLASALNVHLSADRLRRLSGTKPLSEDLHDQWLRGQDLINAAKPDTLLAAEEIFTRLLEQAPEFAPTYSALVQIKNSKHIVFPGRLRNRLEHLVTLRSAQRATQLDPQDSRARLGVAWAYQLAGQLDAASMNASLALDLNPSDAWTTIAVAQILAYSGHFERAMALCDHSCALSVLPSRSQLSYASAIHFLAGHYTTSAEHAAGGLDYSPSFLLWGCAASAHLGRTDDAHRTLSKIIRDVRKQWVGDQPPTDANICTWLLHIFPIGNATDWHRLQQGLAAAGGDVSGATFGEW